jgi:alpha-1,2-mannosyltransferase
MARVVGAAIRHAPPWAGYAAVGVLAFLVRLYPVLTGGGLHGTDGYDDGVYVGGAEAVVDGRLPYRDFLLLHPPGMVYLLAPFALLGKLVGESDGWAVARLAVMALGAVSAVLVILVLRPFGPAAALAGGVLYAVWPPVLGAETSTLLEAPANTLLLAALLVLGRRRPRPRAELVAGAALGLATTIKIWGVAPLLVVLMWQLLTRGRRPAGQVALGAAVGICVVCLPTFILAPRRMVDDVVSSQLQRAGSNTSPLLRAAIITPVSQLWPHASTAATVLAVSAFALLTTVCAAIAWRRPKARIFVVLLVAQGLVLGVSPSFFPHYAAYLAPAVALTAGVAAGALLERGGRTRSVARAPFLVALAVTYAVLLGSSLSTPRLSPFDGARIRAVLGDRRCVASDAPGPLVLAGVLYRNLGRRCPTRIDVSGATYTTDRVTDASGTSVARQRNPLWQKDILGYLLSGQAAVVSRRQADGFTPATWRTLSRLPVLYRARGVIVLATNR